MTDQPPGDGSLHPDSTDQPRAAAAATEAAAARAGPEPVTDGSGQAPHAAKHGGATFGLALGSVGVVFGDIGTSPLYAFRVALNTAAD